MDGNVFSRVWDNLVGRVGGPLSFRLLIQPTVAAILAIRDGVKDARAGRPPYFWSLFTDKTHRRQRLRDGWKSIAKIFVVAVILDAVYQFIVLRWFYPGETLIVAFILAIVPYILLRGPANRLARRRKRNRSDSRRAA